MCFSIVVLWSIVRHPISPLPRSLKRPVYILRLVDAVFVVVTRVVRRVVQVARGSRSLRHECLFLCVVDVVVAVITKFVCHVVQDPCVDVAVFILVLNIVIAILPVVIFIIIATLLVDVVQLFYFSNSNIYTLSSCASLRSCSWYMCYYDFKLKPQKRCSLGFSFLGT